MADFSRYAPKLWLLEGGFANDPDDAGGATMRGITLATYRAHYGRGLTVEDLKTIPYSRWYAIMRTYWDRCRADGIVSQSVAEMFVDWHVNAGKNAIRRVQRALDLDDDGIVGPMTLLCINAGDPREMFRRIREERIDYYWAIVARRPSQSKFLRGWINRVNYFIYEE